jgi:hypothetical protein
MKRKRQLVFLRLAVAALALVLMPVSLDLQAECPFAKSRNNYGSFISHECSNPCSEIDWCEKDNCAGCGGTGVLYYCIFAAFCGPYPGCLNCPE